MMFVKDTHLGKMGVYVVVKRVIGPHNQSAWKKDRFRTSPLQSPALADASGQSPFYRSSSLEKLQDRFPSSFTSSSQMSAVTCHFERRGCHHSALFLPEYKRYGPFPVSTAYTKVSESAIVAIVEHRTNRTKKTKVRSPVLQLRLQLYRCFPCPDAPILRCFPHCCPEHLNRSYCGSSLCVRVHLVDPASLDAQQQQKSTTISTANPASLLVYAHFEAAHAYSLAINDMIEYDEVASFTQTEQTPKGTWIEGAVVSDSVADQHSSLFQINPGARWYYEWESAATKAQRFTKHALRVYIFQRVQTQLRVVGLVSSSEFMVVSYRRAPSEVRAEREALEALRSVVSSQQVVPAETARQSSDRIAATFERKSPLPGIRRVTGREELLWQNRKLWECQQQHVMTSSKQLAILYYFLDHVNASSHGSCLDQLGGIFRDQVARDRAVKAWEESEPSSWIFLEPLTRLKSDTDNLNNGREMEGDDRDLLTRLVQICSSLAGWLALDSANLEIYRRFLRSYSAGLLDKNRVRVGYIEAVTLMAKLVDRFMGWSEDSSASSSTSLSFLSEEIMTVVFKYDHLKPIRRVLLDVLSSNTMFGMHEFVAQLRAQYLLQQAYTMPTHHNFAWADGTQVFAFDGAWDFNGRESIVTPIQGSSATDVSLSCLLTFMRELARINIRPVDGQSLEIFSDFNICSVATGKPNPNRRSQAGMTLILDSRQRLFSNFPSGISSSVPVGGHNYGDYCGKLISSSSFVVEMASWPLDTRGIKAALRWKFQIDIETNQSRANIRTLVVKVVLEEGFLRLNDGDQTQSLQVVPFDLKHEAVEAWYPTYEMVGVYDRVG
ncbi:hypothetical protein P3T76_011755 [Phytophthora citrophthora]|uniref:Uncharacterized protein n=1 Tax=Phytophthora citrophthora TaxID=4793 RepID=A0AAD9LEY4_9STRA|nr:hypothetical protein P3T76_011755 [Phytophthora citrophthora]